MTVALMPEAEEVDVLIKPADLRIDTYRAQGAGGASTIERGEVVSRAFPLTPCAPNPFLSSPNYRSTC
jgi:hypothetical protein